MGDWKSRAYMEYIDLSMDHKVSNMVKFVDEMDARIDGEMVSHVGSAWPEL